LQRPPAYDATVAASQYQAPVDQLMLALKFGGKLALAPLFGHLLRDTMITSRQPTDTLPDLLAPVPLSAERLQQRGFNQSLEIARTLARLIGIDLVAQLALRVRDTQAQAALPIAARRKNIRHAFVIEPHNVALVQGRHIGIIDDVMTTGETLQELAITLKRCGAAQVTNLVVARTMPT
jgi:ComF family protein